MEKQSTQKNDYSINDFINLGVSILSVSKRTPSGIDRYDYTKLWSLQIGDYFMPLSQEFTLRAKKKLNVSSLVDGIDIIQQTRKDAKTIDCSMRFTLRDNNPNLTVVEFGRVTNEAKEAMNTFAKFLQEFYESDAVLEIKNETINNVFDVRHVIISEYKFTPRKGSKSFQFDFSLTEVIYGNDVLTFDVREMV